ncbi:hypothetical protein D9615_009461 [Tricholomella constricta]|uniref:HNH nuclease domain-containing protein n=1 Tax=Tricholomella constricta TaxID=117010 RepID=A0A8H5GYV2_9AGAR|nr:hypothetical protein D9615_009461 [Tricholomella constricta]
MSQLSPFPLALLELIDENGSVDNPPLGMAKRSGVQTSSYNVPAHRLLHALIEHAPSPDTMAREFLEVLMACRIKDVEESVRTVLDGTCTNAPQDWGASMHQLLEGSYGDLTSLKDLSSHYLSHLVIAFRNPGGKKTPQDSIHPTPTIVRIEQIDELLEKATVKRSQSALKDLARFHLFAGGQRLMSGATQTHAAIGMFTGRALDADFVLQHINHPNNALNLETNAHDSMDKHLAWGIEATFSDTQWRYYFRVVRDDLISPYIKLAEGDEIIFGKGEGGKLVKPPDPTICNLHLAISRVSYASGTSEVFDQFLDDDDESPSQVPVYFGSPFVSDETLMRKLEVVAY